MVRKFLFFALNFHIVFAKTVLISGVVFNIENEPTRKAIVTLSNLDNAPLIVETTNRKGRFKMKNVKPDFYYLTVEHPEDGQTRIKINPRKKRNRDIVLRLTVAPTPVPPIVYTFSNAKPLETDPALRMKPVKTTVDIGKIIVEWGKRSQAKTYQLYRDDEMIFQSNENSFEDTMVVLGMKHCYKIIASGDHGLYGPPSEPVCNSALTAAPYDIHTTVEKNNILLKWDAVNGARSYNIYRGKEIIGSSIESFFKDDNLEYSKNYIYSISSKDGLNIDGPLSEPVNETTREFVAPPVLSSLKDEKSIKLIWNVVALAKYYKLYRDGAFLRSITNTSFLDYSIPGESHCYQTSSIDKYEVESELSGKHCAKVFLKAPTDLQINSDTRAVGLIWDRVEGAFDYRVYKRDDTDSLLYLDKVKSTSFHHTGLGYAESVCYVVSAVDAEGDESGYSRIGCGKTSKPPRLKILKFELVEPSGNMALDSREDGKLRFAIVNEGKSLSKNINLRISPEINDLSEIEFDTLRIIKTLDVDEAKYIEFDIFSKLKVPTVEWKFSLTATESEGFDLAEPYPFSFKTESVDPSKMILADYAVSNDFGTHYIPKNEVVELTIRFQNIGEGPTEYVNIDVIDNHTFSMPNSNGIFELAGLQPGEYADVDMNIKSSRDHFAILLKVTDYLDQESSFSVALELMKHYRSKKEMMVHDIGTKMITPYPDRLSEIDVERNIPIGRKNPNAMAVVLALENYDDIIFPLAKYAERDARIFRLYLQNSFGLDDYQVLPSKPWQMEAGPTREDFDKIFDPHQGDLRNRIFTASKYSGIDQVDIHIYYAGLGFWHSGQPYLIPKDGHNGQIASFKSLEKILSDLSLLSVLQNIRTMTIFLDIRYINPDKAGEGWQFPDLSDKICILAASMNDETSNIYEEKRHSIFTYYLLKGLSGEAKGDDSKIELGELAEYIYRKIPETSKGLPGKISQSPSFIGSDLNRLLLHIQ